MYILSLDSTAIAATVALCDDEKLLACTTIQNGNTCQYENPDSQRKSINSRALFPKLPQENSP